jgi:hypothetical protein
MTGRHQVVIYQVATGALSQGNVAPPLRDILRHQRSRPERTITAQQVFARWALAASVRGAELDE